MYMSNNKKQKKNSYNTGSFPANYSGQYTAESFRPRDISYERVRDRDEIIEGRIAPERGENREAREHKHEDEHPRGGEHISAEGNPHGEEHIPAGGHKREGEPEHKGSILDSLGGIFKKRDDGGGFLKNLFSGKKIKNIFTDLDFEDLILLGVMFFLLRDGAEDELLIILAIILFTGG